MLLYLCFFFFLGFGNLTLVFIRMGDRVPSKHLGALKMGDFGIAKVLSCTLACVGPSGFSFLVSTSFFRLFLKRTLSSDHDGW